jgi:hypothetical protein
LGLLVLWSAVLAAPASAVVLRVDSRSTAAAPDGASWATAYRTLPSAIGNPGGNELWVAEGVYNESIAIGRALAIYGGFSGSETFRNQRDISAHRTTLTAAGASVVAIGPNVAQATLDGLTISGGSASQGGGILALSSMVTVARCTITGNAAFQQGGGIAAIGSAVTVTDSVISKNTARVQGGGLYLEACTGRVAFSVVEDNRADIVDPSSGLGGGIAIAFGSPLITANLVRRNRAVIGSAFYLNETTARLENCVIRQNRGELGASGSAAYVNSGAPVLANNTICRNGSGDSGFAVSIDPNLSTHPTLANNIIAFNTGGVTDYYGSAATSRNDVFGNGVDYISQPGVPLGANDISLDPALVDDLSGAAHLSAASPMRDTGDLQYVRAGSTDIDGADRVVGGAVDIGADEFDGTVYATTGAYRVSPSGNDASDGLTWATAKRTVQGGIDTAVGSGVPVWVAAGTYNERVDMRPDVALYGGFAGTESALAERDVKGHETILDGGNAGTVVAFTHGGNGRLDGFTVRNGSGTPSTGDYRRGGGVLVYGGSPTIANNLVTGNSLPGLSSVGGGLCCFGGTPVIEGNVFADNAAAQGGGVGLVGAAGFADLPVIRNNTFQANRASYSGGGLAAAAMSAHIEQNAFTENTAVRGGAIYSYQAFPIIVGNVIRNNRAEETGGGISMAEAAVLGNVISGNSAKDGGGLYLLGSQGAWQVANNTIVANEADRGGAAFVFYATSTAAMANNIIAWNTSGIYKQTADALIVRNNCLWANALYDFQYLDAAGKFGNIAANPHFVAVLSDLHIQPDSPCRDAGDNGLTLANAGDIDGQPRIQGAHVDIGADESDGTTWSVPVPVVRVRPGGNDAADGSTWATAKATVQAGANALIGMGGEVWAAEGVYEENIIVPPFVTLYGGFAGAETERDARNWRARKSVLDGGAKGSVVTFAGQFEAGGLDGFTVRNGLGVQGGGVNCAEASPTVANCRIAGNVAVNGGGVWMGANSHVLNCFIVGNAATASGGAAAMQSTSGTLVGNRMTGNAAGSCSAVSVYYVEPGQSPLIANNTIVANHAVDAFAVGLAGGVDFRNNIVAFNPAGVQASTGAAIIQNNCLYGNAGRDFASGSTTAAGTIAADPLLAGALTGDFHIQPGSPCVNAGLDGPAPAETDMDGQPRVQGAHVDIGADESDGTVWPAPRVVRVAPSGDDANSGESWASAKRSVQAGIDALTDAGGDVWVAAGVYAERITLAPFVHVCGGFAGAETERAQAQWAANRTILDGGQGGSSATVPPGAAPSTLDGFTIRGGKAAKGGGISIRAASPTIQHNRIEGNAADEGAGIHADTSQAIIANNVIVRNAATGLGGGIYTGVLSAAVVNNTIAENTAADGGGYASRVPDSNLVFSNNIIAFNSSGVDNDPSWATARYNCVAMNAGYDYRSYDPTGQRGNIRVDPDFVDRAGGDYRLRPTSLCIDRGDAPSAFGDRDIDGEPRIQFGKVDIGADESGAPFTPPPPRIVRVSPTGNNANDGSSWAMAKRTIQAAAEAAYNPLSEVWAAEGVYRESVLLWSGADIYGGFAGSETERAQRDPGLHPTRLDFAAVKYEPGVQIVAFGADEAVLDGLTMQNAVAGAVFCDASSLSIRNCIFTANRGSYGGVVGVFSGAAEIVGNVFTDNFAFEGAAIRASGTPEGSVLIAGNVFTANRLGAGEGLGGVLATDGWCEVRDNLFQNNERNDVSCSGAGVSVITRNTLVGGQSGIRVSGTATIANNLIIGHKYDGIRMVSGVAVVSGNTIAANGTGRLPTTGSYYYGAGVRFDSGAMTLANNIVNRNGYGIVKSDPSQPGLGTPTLYSNCLFGNLGTNAGGIPNPIGTNGNISAEPLLGADYRLAAGSPCIDAGDDARAVGAQDRDGAPRIFGAHVDMGAYERQTLDLNLTDASVALRLAGGLLKSVSPAYLTRLNVVDVGASQGRVDLLDAITIARLSRP